MIGRSLQFKIIVMVVGALFIGFSLITFTAIKREEKRIFEEIERSSGMMAMPILNTIYSDMLDERAELVYYLMKDLRLLKGVERIEIIRKNGLETAFSDEKTLNEVEKEHGELKPDWKTPRIPQSKEVIAAVRKPEFKNALELLRNQNIENHLTYIEEVDGRELFTYLVKIEDRKRCGACHEDGKARGVLMITTSLEDSYGYIRESRNHWTKMGFLMIGIIGVTLVLSLRRSVLKPIEKMAEAAHFIAKGDFGNKLEVKSQDEIGILANALNDMDSRLSELYTNLEDQVQKRTEELAATNQQLAATNQELIATNEELQASYTQLESTSADLEVSNDELKKANQEIEDMESLKTDFIQTISQELRVPLTPILGYIDLMREDGAGELTHKQKEIVEEIHLCGRNLQMVVDELLEISALQTGNIAPQFEDVDVHSVISSVVKDMKMYADEKSIEIDCRLPHGQFWVAGDGRRLAEIFTHIIRNSLKFTRSRGRVCIETLRKDRGVEIVISDDGIGIPKEKLDKILEAFGNADSDSSIRFKGIGLGFYLVKRLVDMHNGNINIKSDPETGTNVTVYIPQNR